MTVKSDEFAEEIINMHSDTYGYFNSLSLVYYCPPGEGYGKSSGVKESKEVREAYKLAKEQENNIRKIERNILEQGTILKEQKRKIETVKDEMKKQERELRDIKTRGEDTEGRLDSLNISALFRNELYMDQLRSGRI